MVELLFNSWFRQQKLIDDIRLFKFVLITTGLVLLLITNLIIIGCTSPADKLQAFFYLNLFGLFLTQYNLPLIKEELARESFRAYIILNRFYYIVLFTILKNNILILIFLICILLNIIFNFENIGILLLTAMFQTNFFYFRLSDKKHKLLFCAVIMMNILLLFNLDKTKYLLPILAIINGLICKQTLKPILVAKLFNPMYKQESFFYSYRFATFILLYFRRLKGVEYFEVLIISLLGIILNNTISLKSTEYMLIILFIAQIELLIEKKQIQFNKTYLKNCFYNALELSSTKKFLYSQEFKSFLLNLCPVMIIMLTRMVYEGFKLEILLWGLNTALMLAVYAQKISSIFMACLNEKKKFKATVFTLIMIYPILLFINIDRLFLYAGLPLENRLKVELIRAIFVILCFALKFEQIVIKYSIKSVDEHEISGCAELKN